MTILWQVVSNHSYRFAMIPKNSGNPFFDVAYNGCDEEAKRLSYLSNTSIICDYVAPASESEDELAARQQVQILEDMIQEKSYDGIVISALNAELLTPTIDAAMAANIPIVTYDSDAAESKRLIHIGTDNFAFGDMLGSLLLQHSPLGGKYTIVTVFPSPNLAQRVEGVLHALDRSEWTYIGPVGGVDGKGSTEESLIVMHDLASNPNLNAIIPVLGGPMFDFEGWKEFVTTYANLTLVVGDAISTQIELLELGFVNGLVGQLPSEMGRKSVQTLVKVLNKEETQDTLAKQDPTWTCQHSNSKVVQSS